MRFESPVLTLVLLFLLSASVFVFTEIYRSPKSSSDDYVKLVNKTSAFQVIQAKRAGNELTLSLLNNYDQSITAFVLTIGKGFRIEEDFITSEASDDVGIQPQQTFERVYPIPSDAINAEITLQAVILADKSGDGDAIMFEDVRDTRVGRAVQIRRSLRVLEKYLNDYAGEANLINEMTAALDRPDRETIDAIKQIRPVGTINRKSSDALSDSVKAGLVAARTDVLRRLNEAKTSPSRIVLLLETKTYYEKLLNRL